MRRILVTLATTCILFPVVLIFSSLSAKNIQAASPAQDTCAVACACEGFIPEQVRADYNQRKLRDDGTYYNYDYPSLCAEKYGGWVEGGSVESMADILRKAGYFLEEMEAACRKCRGESAPVVEPTDTPEPSIELQPVEPTKEPAGKPTAMPSPTQELPFPEIEVELERMRNGSPAIGVAADGKSFLDISITNKDAAREVAVSLGQNAAASLREGSLLASDGSDLLKKEVVLPPGTKSTFRFVPPAQLEMTGNTRSWSIGGESRKITGFIAEAPFVFSCQDCQEIAGRTMEFYIFQPPALLVHGYLGSESTWKNMAAYLIENSLDVVPGTYDPPPPDSWIQVMAGALGDDIQNLLTEYRDQGIKIGRVDIVCHSMGGLISRWYIDNNLGEGVRKLIMLATPNHGVDDWHRVTRVIASGWTGSHLFAGMQLNADSNFFAELNTFETEMNHLDPAVEYANLIGRASCGRFCPDDAVVPIASAHLNGVVEYIFDGTIHSSDLRIDKWPDRVNPWFSKSDVGIVDSGPVMQKVFDLLTHPIPRANPDFAWSMVLQEGSGEVYLIGEDRQLVRAENYPLQLEDGANIRTGATGKAVIILYLNGQEQKRIGLAGYSDIVFGVSSPDTLTTILLDGSGKFTTSHTSAGEITEAQFDAAWVVDGVPPEIKLRGYLRDLDTGFVLNAGNRGNVIVLEGSVLVDSFDADGAPVSAGEIIKADANQAVYIGPDGNLQKSGISNDPWWEDSFFTRTYPVPEWVAAQRREVAGERPGITVAPGNFTNGGLILLGGSVCLGGTILAIVLVVVLARRRKAPSGLNEKSKGVMGLSGWLLAAAIAGLVIACLGTSAGILWWQGAFDFSTEENVMTKPGDDDGQQIFVQPIPVELPPHPVLVSDLPAGESIREDLSGLNNLSADGPWLVFAAENGLWAANENGSGLSQLIADAYTGPDDLQAAVSPNGSRVAFITASDPNYPQDAMLFIISLPDVKLHGAIDLTLPENAPMADTAVCDPGLEAARAATIGNGLAWSPDGTRLAFSAALDGGTADVYLYSFEDGNIKQLTDEPGNAYDLHWSADENKILYFSANCFGSGGGFDMEGVYTVNPDTGGQELVYRPNEQSYGEEFVGWLFTDRSKFITATVSGCPYRDLRLIDMRSKETDLLYEGCFEDYAAGPTSMLAVLVSADMSDRPGVYLFPEPEYRFEPLYFKNINGRRIEFEPGLMAFLVQNHEQGYKEIISVDLEGKEGWYNQRGEFPAFSMDGAHWVWEDQGNFYLGGFDLDVPQKLLDQPVNFAQFREVITGMDIVQQATFIASTPPFTLYRLVPGQPLERVGEGMRPVAQPVIVYP